jgi:hypothetical protein
VARSFGQNQQDRISHSGLPKTHSGYPVKGRLITLKDKRKINVTGVMTGLRSRVSRHAFAHISKVHDAAENNSGKAADNHFHQAKLSRFWLT